MLDAETVRLAQRLIENRYSDRDADLRQEISKIKSEATRDGMLQSSRTILVILRACNNDLRIRAAIVLEAYMRAVRARQLRLDDSAQRELRNHIAQDISDGALRVRELIAADTGLQNYVRTTDMEPTINDNLRSSEDAAKNHADTEAEFFLAAAAAAPSAEAGHGETVNINVSGPVGAIQTGGGASASFSITINQGDKDILVQALQSVRTDVEALEPTEYPPADQTIAAIDSASQELAKESPSKVTVGGLLSGIGGAISAVASLRPAYETLKSAAVLIGISLP